MATKKMAAITSRDRGCLRRRHFSVITKTASARTYVAIVGLLALGALFAALGAWQLAPRGDEPRDASRSSTRGATDAVLAALPSSLDDAARFRKLEVGGEYVARPQFLLDNMLHDGVAGYHVLTALRVPGRRERVLVNRGWVPAGGDRRVLPDVEVDGASARRRRDGSSGCRARACGSAPRATPALRRGRSSCSNTPRRTELARAARRAGPRLPATARRRHARWLSFASGARPVSRPSGISRMPASGWRWRSAPRARRS